jgi:predicted metal-dependent hydrolase
MEDVAKANLEKVLQALKKVAAQQLELMLQAEKVIKFGGENPLLIRKLMLLLEDDQTLARKKESLRRELNQALLQVKKEQLKEEIGTVSMKVPLIVAMSQPLSPLAVVRAKSQESNVQVQSGVRRTHRNS